MLEDDVETMNSHKLIKKFVLAVLLSGPIVTMSAVGVSSSTDVPNRLCEAPGNWIVPESGAALPRGELMQTLSQKRVVLLGESHHNADHHRWQLQMLAALHGRVGDLVIGFEMFPRRVQPVLDRWIGGELSEEAFLSEVEWRKVWGFDPDLYTPILHFARQNRIPTVALNVERSLVSSVGQKGWEAIPESEREGVTDPRAASTDYQNALAEIYLQKRRLGLKTDDGTDRPEPDSAEHKHAIDEIVASNEFQNFVAAQLTWDRAMAQKLAEAAKQHPAATVVGIIGSGHLTRFHGVPHQLADLGIADGAVLLPVAVGEACRNVEADLADAVFTIDSKPSRKKARPRMLLGVMIRGDKTAVEILEVVPDSVAAATKLQAGDRIKKAAGLDVTEVRNLQKIVSRQAPGTWLPLVIERDGKDIEVVAKFGNTPVE